MRDYKSFRLTLQSVVVGRSPSIPFVSLPFRLSYSTSTNLPVLDGAVCSYSTFKPDHRCVRFTHQRVPIRRVPSRSFFTLRSARSARNESLCPSTYQLERSVARRKVFGIRIDDSKHRTRCCFPFDLFTRQRSTAGINRPLSVRRINISRTPACTLPSSISFVRSFVRSYERFEPKGNERPRSILFRFFEKFCPSTRCSFDGSEERKKKKKLPANNVSRYIDESFLRLCLSYRVGPVYPTVLIELSSRRLSASACLFVSTNAT